MPAKLLPPVMNAKEGEQSLVKVIDAAPKQIPSQESIERAYAILKSAEKPLIILGKGAAYSQSDVEIKELIEKTGIPYLPMSMAKGISQMFISNQHRLQDHLF